MEIKKQFIVWMDWMNYNFGGYDNFASNKERAINIYKKRNQDIIDYFPSDKLLIFDPQEGWPKLYEFLNVDIPQNIPFPHKNRKEDFEKGAEEYGRRQNKWIKICLSIIGIISLFLVLSKYRKTPKTK